jgi:hypothetical protein
MPNLSIKNVPDDVLEKLRRRAARHHRSLQGELMAVIVASLDAAGGGSSGATSSHPAPSGTSDPPALRRSGTRRIEEIAAEHRQRHKRPLTRAPRAVDLIRAQRDAR